MTEMTVAFIFVGGWLPDRPQTYGTVTTRARLSRVRQNPLAPPPPLPPPLNPPPPDPDELGLDDMLLAAALDMLLMLDAKLMALNCPVPPVYQLGGSR
ncbi:MAG TPA: hypothetical protein VHE82_03305 [Gemmatimonadaceae bacterium]|nr:hypothetical protein [Gemmatimonadaceae bacterium]